MVIKMKTRYEDNIILRGTLSREAAKWLVMELGGNLDFSNIVADIDQQLKPWFSCTVTCCGPCMDSEDFK
jgi:hypothetical protein